jgi:hypothetical protein
MHASGQKVSSDRNLDRTLSMAQRLIDLSDQGEANSCDDGCALLYGVVRDCGYRIRAHAVREKDTHDRRNTGMHHLE